jgi:hypothetical protein
MKALRVPGQKFIVKSEKIIRTFKQCQKIQQQFKQLFSNVNSKPAIEWPATDSAFSGAQLRSFSQGICGTKLMDCSRAFIIIHQRRTEDIIQYK